MKIQIIADSKGEFIKVVDNIVKEITIATLRPCKESAFLTFNKKAQKLEMLKNCWELKTTNKAQNKISCIISLDKQMNEKYLMSILKRFKKDFGIGKKYCEQDIILVVEYNDYIDNDIDKSVGKRSGTMLTI